MLIRILPFIGWFKGYRVNHLRQDLIAGLTVALVLVPQSMAYAQLAGLPAYYGLYAAFLPPMIAALFGSSRQLATGPVAVVSLMTATALEPFATAGSASFIGYAILLALLVGTFQFLLGVFKLGVVVNFLSHPVVNGFTNAAALIIATSQLSKLFGVYVDKAEHHYETVHRVIAAAFDYTHWPTVALAILAFAIMIGLKRINPKIPNVLVAVVVCTLVSWGIGLEHNVNVPLDRIRDEAARQRIKEFNRVTSEYNALADERVAATAQLQDTRGTADAQSKVVLDLEHRINLLNSGMKEKKALAGSLRSELRATILAGVSSNGNGIDFYAEGELPPGEKGDGRSWRLKLGNTELDTQSLLMQGGGAVVGTIPRGLPSMKVPNLDPAMMLNLASMAVIISLIGFMEAISIAKAMAARTGQRLDPNQELIGQGLGNIVGSFGQSYAASGSFSRSAVNIQAGAVSGLSSVFSSAVVVATLLFFTPLLYHLPQAVLAAIIMMAVFGLLNVKGFIHAWKAQKYDGVIGVICFVCTLGFAPDLDHGIIIGVVLSLGLHLWRSMKPDMAMLSLNVDGSYRHQQRFELQRCRHIAVVRYNGSVFFANVNYLEDQILSVIAEMPELRHVIIVGNGINELDSSGEEMISLLVDRLREAGLGVSITGLNDSVLDVMRRTALYDRLGEENLYRSVQSAVRSVWGRTHHGSDEDPCPLLTPPMRGIPVSTEAMRPGEGGKPPFQRPDSKKPE